MDTRRQSELFASKDWLVLYQAFTTVNFNASDPTSINQALRDYIANNYPEDFNDWIESSEFVAIIDMLAWLAGTLAFKTDINARENFLETAEARESVLRLARFLSYNPRRNRPATGLLKLVEVSTDDEVVDSTGVNLKGTRVQWNNPDDPDWFERFSAIMNSALVSTNQFGSPLKSAQIGNAKTHVYRINCLMGANNWAFNTTVNGEAMEFELCNGDFNDLGAFEERIPDNNASFNMFYRNDGNGNGSARTGFFALFKQGTTVKQSFRIDYPEENQILDLTVSGVNEDDVWVQTVTDQNELILNWNKVPAIFSSNITYNDIPNTERDIFSVISREEDRASIRFSDGIFGNAPIGNIRACYRVSNGKFYQIKPSDINRITHTVSYFNTAGEPKTLKMIFSLQETVSNATPRETEDQIRERAPSIYATQNRMVSGEDYNTFPISSNLATKVKAVNRVYSGHSRFVDLNDPTSTYTDVVVTSDDGMLYNEIANIYEEVPLVLNKTASELVSSHIQSMLRKGKVKSYIYDNIINRVRDDAPIPEITIAPSTVWTRVSAAKFSSSGWFSSANSYFRIGASLLFTLPNGENKWVTISQLSGELVNNQPASGIRGPVTLSEDVPSGSLLIGIIPQFTSELSLAVISELSDRFNDTSDLRGFSLWFDPEDSTWIVRDTIVGLNETTSDSDIIHVMTVEYLSGVLWKFSARGMRYVFESARKVKWYYSGERVLDSETGAARRDTISVLRSNSDIVTGLSLGSDKNFQITDLYYYRDGSQEPRRVVMEYLDSDLDGAPDDPYSFSTLTNIAEPQGTLFWELGTAFGNSSYIPTTNISVFTKVITSAADIPSYIRLVATEPSSHYVFRQGDIVYMKAVDAFYRRVNNAWVEQPRNNFRVARGRGSNTARRWMEIDTSTPSSGEPYVRMYSTNATEVAQQGLGPEYVLQSGNLMFKWKHYAPIDHRIDPSLTNIVDVFMLTREYDFATRLWIANGAHPDEVPVSPTELDLRILMSQYEQYKMFTDEIIWRPARFKYLFGTGSEEYNLRAKFKVVKLQNSSLADGEIKSRVISAINAFFDSSRWDFGETFYYTELAAFIHQQLVGQIGSVVIVPIDDNASFGEGFEIKSRSDEIFISTAQVSDVEIITSNTTTNLRIR